MGNWYVYRHIRLDKNEPFYIGIGKTEKRAYEKIKRNQFWQNVIAKTDYDVEILFDNLSWEDAGEKEYLKNTMANFMKKQYLSHNNDAVENNVIADHLKELSKGELILENPDELVNTNTLLRSMGIGSNNKKFTKSNNFKQKQKKKFKKQ